MASKFSLWVQTAIIMRFVEVGIGIETFISPTQDTTVILKFMQYLILSTYIAAISKSYGPI